MVRNVVQPFAWDAHGTPYDRARFLQTAERVMARRKVTMSIAMRACLAAVHDFATKVGG